MSMSSSHTQASRVLGTLLLATGAVLGVIAPSHTSLLSEGLAGVGIISCVLASLLGTRATTVLASVSTVCDLATVAASPPVHAAALIIMVPLGLCITLGLLFITSQHSPVASLRPFEWMLVLGSGVFAALVVIVALITPLTALPRQLLAGVGTIVVLGALSRLAFQARRPGSLATKNQPTQRAS